MFKIGDKIRNNESGNIFEVTGLDPVFDLACLKNVYGYSKWYSRIELTSFTKVDSDADSTGLYGVDSSVDKDWSPNSIFAPTSIPYPNVPAYTISKSGNYTITMPGILNPGYIVWNEDKITESKIPICQCGALKTYGDTCNPEFHSTWCEMGKK